LSQLVTPSFEFVLGEYGWADLIVGFGEEQYRIESISYCTEALPDLLQAGVTLSFGLGDSIMFDHEGSRTDLAFELEWITRPEPIDNVHADLRCRVRASEERPIGNPKTLFSKLCESHDVVARALLECGDKVWSEYGPMEYDRRWISDGFPIRQLAALRASLEHEPFPTWEYRGD
jgi:hypothetical protein